MPLPKRVISPVFVCRDALPADATTGGRLQDDLEAVTNGTLANIVRQLSGLSRHAEDLFGELYRQAEGLNGRSQVPTTHPFTFTTFLYWHWHLIRSNRLDFFTPTKRRVLGIE